jgi:hypothetical protein
VIATKVLDRIGELLREKGFTLEEMIEARKAGAGQARRRDVWHSDKQAR